MENVKRFGVSLEKNLLDKLDKLVIENNFPNRSQAIRHLIRNHIIDSDWKSDGIVAGALVLIYNHHRRSLVNELINVQHEYTDCILSSQHVHLDHDNCIEIIALKGKASVIKSLSNNLISLKGIIHGKIVISGVA